MAQSTISKILSRADAADTYTPSAEVLHKLFGALGLRLGDILDDCDEVERPILGYLATPLTGLTETADNEVRRVVARIRTYAGDATLSTPPFEIYWPGDYTHPKAHVDIPASQVYVTDRSRASTHDFIILFCGASSYGVGQENEIATQSGVPAIRLMPPGISRMMLGSFVRARDIVYTGSLEAGVQFNAEAFRQALLQIRHTYFRHRAMYRGMNGDGFGPRLRKLIDDRAGDYTQFAQDVGISLSYLHVLMDEPFAVSNPSARILKRLAVRLGERVSYLIGELDETDPTWLDSNAAWRRWIDETPGIDAATAVHVKDQWRHDYRLIKLEGPTTTSHRSNLKVMKEVDGDSAYRKAAIERERHGKPSLFQ